jgi:predicted Zn-ribbon and HTH transcriptional regulator
MGRKIEAKCLDCGYEFTVNEGGGFVFHLLHCDKCGAEKSISFEELGDLHLRYLKGLKGTYSIATLDFDNYVKENVDIEPISEEEYFKEVETFAGKCDCGGSFKFNAPFRCPKCHSTNIEKGDTILMYD